ncbi:MAG: hypothetical protein ACOX1Y_02790 [Zhaonellaceae bacterium]
MKKPDLATYIGLFGGVFVLLWGMASGSDLSLFLDPPSSFDYCRRFFGFHAN